MSTVSPSPPAPPNAGAVTEAPGSSLGRDAWRRLRQNRFASASAGFLALLVFACLLLPALLGLSYSSQDMAPYLPPGAGHWFGTDRLGHDVFARVLYGSRISLGVGLAATLVSLTIGVTWGAVAGYAGRTTDTVMMRFVDIVYALPFTIFVILLMVFFGRHIVLLFVAIGAVEWLTMARIVRGQVLSLKRMEFIEAARALGFSHRRIIFRHLVPNLLGPVIVYTTLTIPSVMLLEAFLSFLGLGVQPPMSSLGTLIFDGQLEMESHPWLLILPGAIFSLTLFALNFLGDGLRDALDVRAAKD